MTPAAPKAETHAELRELVALEYLRGLQLSGPLAEEHRQQIERVLASHDALSAEVERLTKEGATP